MINNPEYVKVKDKKYKINTDFRIALKCNQVAQDESIGDYERSLAIIYLLFGDNGLKDSNNHEELLNLAIKYLRCGDEEDIESNEKPDMELEQDFRLIEASFKSDYGITLSKENMHWWDFYTYLNGLTDKCALNRVRELRTYDLSTITDVKTKNKIKKMQKQFELKEKIKPMTDKEKRSVDNFYKLTGIKRKE